MLKLTHSFRRVRQALPAAGTTKRSLSRLRVVRFSEMNSHQRFEGVLMETVFRRRRAYRMQLDFCWYAVKAAIRSDIGCLGWHPE